MMLKKRSYAGEQDWQAIADLADSDPVFHHRIDLGWRLCSAALEDFRNAMLWGDETGKLQAFAALQFPWLTTDYAIRPEYRTRDVETEVILWSEARLRQVSEETKRHFPFNVSAFALERERIAFLEDRGYTRWENFIVVLSRSLVSRSEPILPSGFIIRRFSGDAEVEQYVALHRAAFGSTEMTTAWRRRTLQAPLYISELDLVAVAPDGRLAGFCIWWYQPGLKTAQIEPIGIHPDFQQLGLSRALMAEGFKRAAALGAEMARVEAYSFSSPALLAYEAAGFHELTKEYKYYKEY